MEALRQGIGIRPAWLIERLESACADTPGLADLVYQLSRIGNGAQIWSRLKHHLKVTVPPEKRRALVRCIQVFRDREEIDFLRAEASRDEDFVGDMALAALSGIDSGVAAAELAQSNLQHLIFTRRWHFQPLLAAQPEAAQVAIRTLVQRRHDPGALCQMYAGAENAMDVESFEIVLDHLVTALREELATGNPDASSGRLYGPLTTVGAVVVPELVGRLRSRKHGELPRLLGEYLLAIAPRENLSARLTDRIALQVLQRIGDSALLEWVKRGLRTSNKYSRIDALQESHKHADAEVVALLRTIALGALHGQDRFESYLAIHALTHLEAWDAVVEATVASGLSISPFPLEERRGKPPLSGKFVEDLYSQALTGATTPGLLLAAALTRDPRFLEIVRRTVSQTEIQADTLLAAAIAAEALCIQDDVSVQHLASKLRNADAPERLPHIVLRLGTPLALEAVEEHLRRRFDSALCADLAEQAGWESRATQLAWERRFEAERSIGFGYMLPFFTTLGDKSRLHYLEELALGKRRGLIDESLRYQSVRALSKIDRDRAYDAGFGAVQDPTLRQRARLPALLVELDQNRAVPQLIEMVRTGESEELELDVADAVSGCDIGSMIDAMLCSDDATARRAGCILAARREVSESTSRLLRERASDVDALVASAAMHALSELSRARGVRWLIEEAVKLRGERRWTNIDHAVAAGAGNRDVPPVSPSALTAMRGELSPLEVQASHESLRKGADEYRRGVKDRVRRRAE